MLRRSWSSAFTLAFALALGSIAGGCASTPSGSSDRMPGTAPMVSVERFLQAANTEDFDAMARIFGTAGGPIADQSGGTVSCAFRRIGSWIRLSDRCLSRSQIELRMNAIALLLRHDSYRVRSESGVAGRTSPTRRVGVDLEQGSSVVADVPFVVVELSDGRWLVEEIGLERLTSE